MITDTRCWRRITPDAISELPETGAVFEVANLVRTVVFIGHASGNLRTRLATFTQEDLRHWPMPGGYYFRYEQTVSEPETLDTHLAHYINAHGGMLPARNADPAPSLRIASRRAA